MDLADAIAASDFGGNKFAAAYHFAHRFGVAFEIGSGLGDVVGFVAHIRQLRFKRNCSLAQRIRTQFGCCIGLAWLKSPPMQVCCRHRFALMRQ